MISLESKTALVTGVADDIGFGWHIAKTLQAAGAKVIISCHPRILNILNRYLTRDKYLESRQLPYAKGEFKPLAILPCDVTLDSMEDLPEKMKSTKGYEDVDVSIQGLKTALAHHTKSLDILIHSVAFSPEVTQTHLDVSRKGYLTALSASSFSLVALTKALLPFMEGRRGSIVGLTYLASERAVPFYGGGMASAKAALECDARMLSWFIGQKQHRINLVSAGPYASRAAKSIGDIDAMIESIAERSPLQRPISPQEVADTVLFLGSALSSGITGEVVHVDAGFHAMGA